MRAIKYFVLGGFLLCLLVQAPPKKRRGRPLSGCPVSADGGGGASASSGDGTDGLSPLVLKIVQSPDLCSLEGEELAHVQRAAHKTASKYVSVALDRGGRGRSADSRDIAHHNRTKSLVAVRAAMNPVLDSLGLLINLFQRNTPSSTHIAYTRILKEWEDIKKTFSYTSKDFSNKEALQSKFLRQFHFINAFACVFDFLVPFEVEGGLEKSFYSLKKLYETFLGLRDSSLEDVAEMDSFVSEVAAPLRAEPAASCGAGIALPATGGAGGLHLVVDNFDIPLSHPSLNQLNQSIFGLNLKDGSLVVSRYPERVPAEYFTVFDWYNITSRGLDAFYLPLSRKLNLSCPVEQSIPFLVIRELAEAFSGVIEQTVAFLHMHYHVNHQSDALGVFYRYLDTCDFVVGDFTSPLVCSSYYQQINLLKEKFNDSGYVFTKADFNFIQDACLSMEIALNAMYFKISRIPFLPEDSGWVKSEEYLKHERLIRLYLELLKELVVPYTSLGAYLEEKSKRSAVLDLALPSRSLITLLSGYFVESASLRAEELCDFSSAAKPAWLNAVERACDFLPVHLHFLAYDQIVYCYLYGSYESLQMTDYLKNIFIKYKNFADKTDIENGFKSTDSDKHRGMSFERLMIIVMAIKRLLLEDVAGVSVVDRLDLFNEIFDLKLTTENYLTLCDWFGKSVSADAELADLSSFVGMFNCPSLLELVGTYQERK